MEALSRVLARNKRRLFVPEAYGGQIPQASVLICTALSGGNLPADGVRIVKEDKTAGSIICKGKILRT